MSQACVSTADCRVSEGCKRAWAAGTAAVVLPVPATRAWAVLADPLAAMLFRDVKARPALILWGIRALTGKRRGDLQLSRRCRAARNSVANYRCPGAAGGPVRAAAAAAACGRRRWLVGGCQRAPKSQDGAPSGAAGLGGQDAGPALRRADALGCDGRPRPPAGANTRLSFPRHLVPPPSAAPARPQIFFNLARRNRLMRSVAGSWTVLPLAERPSCSGVPGSEAVLRAIANHPHVTGIHASRRAGQHCIVVLHQTVDPAVVPPPPFGRMLRGAGVRRRRPPPPRAAAAAGPPQAAAAAAADGRKVPCPRCAGSLLTLLRGMMHELLLAPQLQP